MHSDAIDKTFLDRAELRPRGRAVDEPTAADLEFDQVFIPELNADLMPFRYELNLRPDQVSREQFEQQERSLLHVAATREIGRAHV